MVTLGGLRYGTELESETRREKVENRTLADVWLVNLLRGLTIADITSLTTSGVMSFLHGSDSHISVCNAKTRSA